MERKIASLFILLRLDDVMTYSFLVYLNIAFLVISLVAFKAERESECQNKTEKTFSPRLSQ